MTRVLVAGGDSQVARALADREPAPGIEFLPLSRERLDLTSADSIAAALDGHRPDVVLNLAAYTAVDAAEDDVDAARTVNALGPGLLAAECAARGVALVHVSTDYVVGTAAVPDPATRPALSAAAPAAPESVYGRTKLDGELAVRDAHREATIVRTAWVYTGPGRSALGLGGSDFVATMIRLEAAGRETGAEITVVDDQWGSPTYSRDLAAGLAELCAVAPAGVGAGQVLHAAGGGRASWWEVARAVFAGIGADPERVRPIPTSRFPRPAPRPGFSVLSSEEWVAAGLTPLRDWRDALRDALRDQPRAADDHEET